MPLNMPMRLKVLAILISVLVIIGVTVFMFFVPIASYKGMDWNITIARKGITSLTCQGYGTPDGLPPGIDEVRAFHVSRLQFRAYEQFRPSDDHPFCYGGLKTVRAKLFL